MFSLVYATPLLQHQAQFGLNPAVGTGHISDYVRVVRPPIVQPRPRIKSPERAYADASPATRSGNCARTRPAGRSPIDAS